ncbi:MAG: tRNA-dihydrouridine synthase [Candidatus Saccharimonadales bacterium]
MDFKDLPKPFLVLAPMDDVTDVVFRRVVASLALPDLFFTEFVNVDGLMSPGRPRLLKKLRFSEHDRPLIAQLWGLKPENFKAVAGQIADGSLAREICMLNDKTGSLHGDAAQGGREQQSESYKEYGERVAERANTAMRPKPGSLGDSVGQQSQAVHTCPNFAGVDLNMGCPAKSEVQNGACSALIKNRPLALEIINATKEGFAGSAGQRMPLSVKTRVGFNEVDMTWIAFLLEQKLNMLTVHGRTRKQMSKVPADWELIGQASLLRDRIAPDTCIVGNGDVESRAQAEALAAQYNLDGVMIGRGVFHDPYVFAKASEWADKTREERIALYTKHVKLFHDTWQSGERPIYTLNKFCKIYIQNFEGAKELREQFMAATSSEQLLEMLQNAH